MTFGLSVSNFQVALAHYGVDNDDGSGTNELQELQDNQLSNNNDEQPILPDNQRTVTSVNQTSSGSDLNTESSAEMINPPKL